MLRDHVLFFSYYLLNTLKAFICTLYNRQKLLTMYLQTVVKCKSLETNALDSRKKTISNDMLEKAANLTPNVKLCTIHR